MKTIVALIVTTIGSLFCGIDFCTVYTLVTITIDIYEGYLKRTNDKLSEGK